MNIKFNLILKKKKRLKAILDGHSIQHNPCTQGSGNNRRHCHRRQCGKTIRSREPECLLQDCVFYTELGSSFLEIVTIQSLAQDLHSDTTI